ncbi:MAG: hypothetical protein RJA70_3083 [Pseudomonadota bacterium]|jgi:di/tricarboxylate transporter
MNWEAWAAVIGVACGFLAMASGRASAQVSFGVVLGTLVLLGVIPASQALAGFANEQVHTVALLFIVAAALQKCGTLKLATSRLFVSTQSVSLALVRLTFPVAAVSAFLNNTPIVAMLLPEVRGWAAKTGISASRLLIPLSYAAILGGLLTIIGTSTNLVVNGLVASAGKQTIGFLEIGKIGLPVAIAGLLVLIPIGRWVLPDRPDLEKAFADTRTFVTEVLISAESRFLGRRLADVKIPDVPKLLPLEIIRGDQVIPAPRADHVLQLGDRLAFAGPAALMLALKRHPDFLLAETTRFESTMDKRVLVELVLAARCPLIGANVGQGGFRRRYNAAIVAVAREGGRVTSQRLEEWQLRVGDVVLVECGSDFLEEHQHSPDFYLVTPRGPSAAPSPKLAWFGLGVMVLMVATAALGWLSMLEAVLVATAVLVVARVLDKEDVQESVDFGVLLAIALALGLGKALELTGAAAYLAGNVTRLGGESPWVSLAMVYLGTNLLTEFVTNNAAAAIAIPLALATAERLGVSHFPFAVAVMVAASSSFATPLGYQTNLMVYGPGNYRFGDFVRAGLVMNVVVASVAISLIPRIWPF